jgi:hypothetical protein
MGAQDAEFGAERRGAIDRVRIEDVRQIDDSINRFVD